jgi:hypothetical protein
LNQLSLSRWVEEAEEVRQEHAKLVDTGEYVYEL